MRPMAPIQPKKILVVRRDNVGDLVCTTPAFAALRERFPEAQIGALVNSYNAEVLHGNPNIDYVFVYQKLKHTSGLKARIRAVATRLKLIVKLRYWRPDITILAKSSYDKHGLSFARQIGAKNIIGFMPDGLNQVTNLPDIRLAPPGLAALHEVEAVNQLLAPLGIKHALGSLQVYPDNRVVERFKRQLPKGSRRIALHISAREKERRWGVDNFIELIKRIVKTQPDTQILLFWSPGKADDRYHPGDDEAAAQIIEVLQSSQLIPVPTQNLSELIAALSICELFVGADGGAMHLAVALDKYVVALFENLSGKLNHWYPWTASSQVIHSLDADNPAIAQISLAQVEAALSCRFE